MEQFWERSWENVDRSRVSEYVQAGVQASDPIRRFCGTEGGAVCDAERMRGVFSSMQQTAFRFRI